MNEVWLYSLGAVFLTSLISLVGVVALAVNPQKLSKIILFLVSFAAGGLFGDSFFHLLPEIASQFGFGLFTSIAILSGILVFFILEKFISWRHCHIPTSDAHPHPIAFMNLIGDGLHNFTDGIVIAASFLISFPLGATTTIAVILHEIPQEIGDFGVLVHGGFSRSKALLFNFLSGLLAILGAFSVLVFSSKLSLIPFLIPFTAGGFIYIAGSDLIPELKKEVAIGKSLLQFLGIVIGSLGMFLLKFLE